MTSLNSISHIYFQENVRSLQKTLWDAGRFRYISQKKRGRSDRRKGRKKRNSCRFFDISFHFQFGQRPSKAHWWMIARISSRPFFRGRSAKKNVTAARTRTATRRWKRLLVAFNGTKVVLDLELHPWEARHMCYLQIAVLMALAQQHHWRDEAVPLKMADRLDFTVRTKVKFLNRTQNCCKILWIRIYMFLSKQQSSGIRDFKSICQNPFAIIFEIFPAKLSSRTCEET